MIDPARAPIVLMIFEDYCLRGWGLGQIADKLNRDLKCYPPPQRNRKGDNGLPQTWSKSQLQSMLHNPKYTGFNVWNRHDKRRGRPLLRARDQWIWSPTPVHEPIVSRELFNKVEERARHNEIRPNRRTAHQYPQRRGRRNGRLYPLSGRVRCALCERRMEGSFQKGSNWYRCRFVWNRGAIAADAAGHPRALGIKEDVILDELIDFMGRRIFGPDRLRLLRSELRRAIAEDWHEHDDELARLQREREHVEIALYRQTLRLEEHDDPEHPVVALAKQRIEELASRRTSIEEAIRGLETRRPDTARPAEIEAMLNAVPDLRPTLRSAGPDELADIFDAFDVTVVYDKPNRRLQLAATVTPELVAENEKTPTESARSGNSSIAGAGYEHPSATAYRFAETRALS